MTHYKAAAQELFQKYKEDFAEFGKVHEEYKKDQQKWQEEFDRIGKPLLRHVEEAERVLCSKMESGGKGKYSSGLAEKFRAEIKKVYPLLDFIGVKIS